MSPERRGGPPREIPLSEREPAAQTEFDWRTGVIPESECEVKAVRGGGKGGQAVNTTSNNVEVRWNIGMSDSLSTKQKQRLREAAGSRVTKGDELVFTSHSERSQLQNRGQALANLSAFVREKLEVKKKRKPTRKSKGVKARERKGRTHLKDKKKGREKVDKNNW
ncbi:MAG: aminoacyl-tRNA hydrolase [bacterium]|jgi:ribosome-associated protein|nr:aminoacyl-tRNA hydrolase [bacterium]